MYGKRLQATAGRSLTDIVLSRLKIFISFFQVTSGTFDAFSYVQWPKALLQLGTYAKFLQLNLPQIAPVNCFSHSIEVTIYTSFMTSAVVTLVFALMAIIYYQLRRLYTIKIKNYNTRDVKDLSEAKEAYFRYVFLLMFTMFPTTSTQVFQMLPFSCHKICVDIDNKSCRSYLRSDYSVECFTGAYNNFVVLAFVMLLYVVGFPLVTLFLLWRYYPKEAQTDYSDQEGHEVQAAALSFLYENYCPNSWFWEFLELVRKIILTSVLVLIGRESPTDLGVATIMSGLYTVLFVSYKPINGQFEHWLQLASLLATSANMNIGLLLKIPEESIPSGIETGMEGTGITAVLISVNVFVLGMIVGKKKKSYCYHSRMFKGRSFFRILKRKFPL